MTLDAACGMGRNVIKLVSPVVYALLLIPAVAVTVLVGSLLAGIAGHGALWYSLLVVAGLAVGAAVYAGAGRSLIASERLDRAGMADHARRCSVLYIVLAVTLLWGLTSYLSTGGVGWPTFATEMQLHIVSVIPAALAVDKLVASGVVNNAGEGSR